MASYTDTSYGVQNMRVIIDINNSATLDRINQFLTVMQNKQFCPKVGHFEDVIQSVYVEK